MFMSVWVLVQAATSWGVEAERCLEDMRVLDVGKSDPIDDTGI